MFLHPAIFWTGLAAVSLPIIIHLLNRRRFKIRDWAAMQFLLESIRKNRRRLRIEELILLAIRCLAVLLLGMAIGRFTGCDAMNQVTGQLSNTSTQNVVYVLDDTVSMGQQLGAGTLFKEALAEVSRQIDLLNSGDKVSYLLVSQPKDEKRGLEVLSDKESLKAQLATLECSDMRGQLEESLAHAKDLLSKEPGDKKVVILSDFRHNDLMPAERQTALRTQYDELRKAKVDIICLDYGRDGVANLSVEDLTLVDKLVLAGERAKLALTVRNNGTTDARDLDVAVTLDAMTDGQMTSRSLDAVKIDDVKAGESRRIEFEVLVPEAGPAVVTARLPNANAEGAIDELRGDDQASLALDARAMMRVLVVDGLPPTGHDITQGEAYLLSRAIDPNQDGGHGVRAQVEPIDVIKDLHFDDYDLVVLMNISSLPIEQVSTQNPDGTTSLAPGCPKMEELKEFVRKGGGLVLFTGEKVDATFWNKYFYASNTGLAPLALGEAVFAGKAGTPYEKIQGGCFRLDPNSIEVDPVLEVFQGDGKAFCELIQFLAFHKTLDSTLPPGGDVRSTRILARFNDHVGTSSAQGSPAMASRLFGQGSVLCFFTAGTSRPQPRGTEWNNWPKETMGTYNLVMLDMLSAYGRPQAKLTDIVGRDFEYQLPGGVQQASAVIKPPGKGNDVISVSTGGEDDKSKPTAPQGRLVCKDTRWAGIYEMDVDLGNTTLHKYFTRFVDVAEGDLRAGQKQALEIAFGGKDFTYIAKSQSTASQRVGDSGKEYWIWVMAAVLMLLAAEVYLGQRFGHYTAK